MPRIHIYTSAGSALKFINIRPLLRVLSSYFNMPSRAPLRHFKTELHNFCQETGRPRPTYRDQFRGPQNNGFWYSVAYVEEYPVGVGEAKRSLIEAQQSAASRALAYFGRL
ncbi:hypothetical protein PM082_007936 [Marasmius tenuissimus]|nr:hypothetical protein PM082_007936 [Marasmius tenuissimus]